MKLGIVVGHVKTAKGANLAAPYKTSEYDYNSDLALTMKTYGISKGIQVEIFKRDGIGIAGAYKLADKAKCDCVIELHFNAFNQKAAGTETLSSFMQDDILFATAIQSAMVKVFGRTGTSNRGVVKLARSGRGGQSLTSYPNGANCLVEPFFGDNPKEAKMAVEKKKEYAGALIDGVLAWSKKLGLK